MNFPDDDPDIPPQINIVSAIDVILAILTFFVISSLYLTRQEGFTVNLPGATTSETQDSTNLVVTVTAEGQFFIEDTSIDLSQLEATVRQRLQTENIALVVLNADASISHGQVIQVMDELRKIEGIRLAIETEKK